GSHQGPGADERRADRLAQDHEGDRGTEEGRQGKVGSRSRRAEVAQRPDEERQAQSVTQEADDQRAARERGGRPVRAGDQAQSEVDPAGGAALDRREPQRIGARNPLSEVVVDGPARLPGSEGVKRPTRTSLAAPKAGERARGSRRSRSPP